MQAPVDEIQLKALFKSAIVEVMEERVISSATRLKK